MLFNLSNLNLNLALTLGYLNPALNNSALVRPQTLKHFLMCTLKFPSAYCGELKTVFGL